MRTTDFFTTFAGFLTALALLITAIAGVRTAYVNLIQAPVTPPQSQPPVASSDSAPPEDLPPNGWVIALETDETLDAARAHLKTMATDNGYEDTGIFFRKKTGSESIFFYRPAIIFASEEAAIDQLDEAQKMNPTITEVKEMRFWCPEPEWVEDGEYYRCQN